MLFRSIFLVAMVAATKAQSLCSSCDCFKCVGASDNGDGTKTVMISSAQCKGGTISWMCCIGSSGGGDGSCGVTTCGGNKCNGVDVLTVTVPDDATKVNIQAHDGQFGSVNRVNTGICGGTETPGASKKCYGGVGKNTGICDVEVDLSKCGCDGICIGDPHFKTWNDEWYDFHGACDLVFLSNPSFADKLGLDIHIRTTIRDEWSFIEAAALRIGTDVLEVTGWGGYMINGVDSAEFPQKIGGFPITYTMENKKKHHFEIKYAENKSIQVHTVKDLVTIQMVNASMTDFGGSVGLMADFESGRKLGRDGKDYRMDVNGFGKEWQVKADEPMLFDATRSPQAPAVCNMPGPRKETSRRLGSSIAMEAAQQACAHWGPEGQGLCVSDVMIMGDLDAAQAGVF